MVEEGARGGICQYTYSLANALARRGVDITLATYTDYELDAWPRDFRVEKIFQPAMASLHSRFASKPIKLMLRGLGHFSSLSRLINYAREQKPDIVHIQWLSLNWSVDWLPFYVFRKMGLGVVFTSHDILPHDTATFIDRLVLTRVHRLADRILVHGEKNREVCLQLFGTRPEKIFSVPMGNYHIMNGNMDITRAEARSKLGLAENEKIVLFFGYIEPYKGLSYLIKAFQLLKKEIPEVRLVIAGRPRGSFAQYSRLISECGLESTVSLHLGYIPMEQVPLFFLASDLVAAPYTETYQSAVIQLAYSFGRPVVATRTGALPDLIENGRSGKIVEPKDEASLAGGLMELLANRQLDDLGTYGKHLGDTRFSWATIAETTENIYREIYLKNPALLTDSDLPSGISRTM